MGSDEAAPEPAVSRSEPAAARQPSGRLIPAVYFAALLSAAQQEAGSYSLEMLMEQAGLPELFPGSGEQVRTARATDLSRLLQAFRHYYGQGGRGLINRVGRAAWLRLARGLTWQDHLALAFWRFSGGDGQQKKALQLLARFLGDADGQISLHAMDRDLILVDRIADTALEQKEEQPICWNMVGMIQACLAWSTGREHDVEEIACRAAGAEACKYRIRIW